MKTFWKDNHGSSDGGFSWAAALLFLFVLIFFYVGIFAILLGMLIGIIKLNVYLWKYKAGRVFVIISWALFAVFWVIYFSFPWILPQALHDNVAFILAIMKK